MRMMFLVCFRWKYFFNLSSPSDRFVHCDILTGQKFRGIRRAIIVTMLWMFTLIDLRVRGCSETKLYVRLLQ